MALGPAGVVGAYQLIEPGMPALHFWVRDLVGEDHAYIVYLKLRDAQQALKDANAEIAKTPGSTTAQRAADYYAAAIKKYQHELDKISGN